MLLHQAVAPSEDLPPVAVPREPVPPTAGFAVSSLLTFFVQEATR